MVPYRLNPSHSALVPFALLPLKEYVEKNTVVGCFETYEVAFLYRLKMGSSKNVLSQLGRDVGIEVGGFVSPGLVGRELTGAKLGWEEGREVGRDVVGLEDGWPLGMVLGCLDGCELGRLDG